MRIISCNYLARSIATVLLLLFILPVFPVTAAPVSETEEEPEVELISKPRIYRNPEERREAGLGTEITDWLKISGLLEIEKEVTRNHYKQNYQITEEEPTTHTLQIGLDAEWDEWLEVEVVFEAEHSRHLHPNDINYHQDTHSKIDEAQVSIDFDSVGLKFGRINVPFGEYYSYFVIGPMLEFGETQRDAVMLDFEVIDNLEITVFGFESKADKLNDDKNFDWGVSMEFVSEDESLRFGASYISDLAESDEMFLEDSRNIYIDRVSAWSAYALFGFNQLEITIEAVQSMDEFSELDLIANKPEASNLEIAYFPDDSWQLALRLAQSRELEDSPKRQHGFSATWRPGNIMSFSFDYIYGEFEEKFVLDDADRELGHNHQVGVRMSMEF